MSTRVVSTKLTEEEHARLLDACNGKGCAPSNFIKEAIMEKLQPKEPEKELETSELRKFLGIVKKKNL